MPIRFSFISLSMFLNPVFCYHLSHYFRVHLAANVVFISHKVLGYESARAPSMSRWFYPLNIDLWKWRFYEGISRWSDYPLGGTTFHGEAPCSHVSCRKATTFPFKRNLDKVPSNKQRKSREEETGGQSANNRRENYCLQQRGKYTFLLQWSVGPFNPRQHSLVRCLFFAHQSRSLASVRFSLFNTPPFFSVSSCRVKFFHIANPNRHRKFFPSNFTFGKALTLSKTT